MKHLRLIVLILLFGLISVACQKSPAGGDVIATQSPASELTTPYPVSDQPTTNEASAYPAPSSASQASLPVSLYPELKDGDMLEWQRVEGTIYSGLASSVSQKHDLQVTIVMKDGRAFVTTEPAIDEIIKIVQQCGDLCKDITIATE